MTQLDPGSQVNKLTYAEDPVLRPPLLLGPSPPGVGGHT